MPGPLVMDLKTAYKATLSNSHLPSWTLTSPFLHLHVGKERLLEKEATASLMLPYYVRFQRCHFRFVARSGCRSVKIAENNQHLFTFERSESNIL